MMAYCDPQKGFRFGSGGLVVILALLGFVVAEPHHDHGHSHGHEHGPHSQDSRGPRINCPQGHFWWKNDGRCYERGVQGPCGHNMVIGEHFKNRNQARCVCQVAANCQYWPYGIVREDALNCYPLFEQGPCGDSEWFVPVHKGPRGVPEDGFMRAKCAPRKCPAHSSQYSVFSMGGDCHHVGTRGFCKNPHHIMHFIKGGFVPVCGLKVIRVPECKQGLREQPPAGGWGSPGPVPSPPVIPPPEVGYGGAPQPPVLQPVQVPPPQNPAGGWSAPVQQPPPNTGYGGPPTAVESGGYNQQLPVLTPGGGYGQSVNPGPSVSSGGYGNPVAETPVVVPAFGGGGYGGGNSGTVLEPIQEVGGYSRLVSSTPGSGALPILEAAPQAYDQPISSTPLPTLPVENTSTKAFAVGPGLKCPAGTRLRSDGQCATVSLF